LFAGIGVLYGWTKEYLFEHMSMGQLVMYFDYGMEMKYGKPKKASEKKTSELTPAELKREKARLRKLYYTPEQLAEFEAKMGKQYGDIEKTTKKVIRK